MRESGEKLFWLKLDNAGKIFPAQNTEDWSNVVRATVVLKEKIDPEVLQQALDDIMPRFPCFAVRLRDGFFWNYLQQNTKVGPKVMPDINNPNTRVKKNENDGFLFRVFYYESRISVEFFHALTDGYGMTRFLMTLTARYLNLKGANIPVGSAVLDINEKPSEDEISDAFLKFGDSKGKPVPNRKGVYHFTGTRLPKHMTNVTTGYMSVQELRKLSKEYGVTMTEFLAGVLLYTVYKKQESEPKNLKQPVSVQIPMNGRFKLPTKTLRNFSLFSCISIDPKLGEYTLDEIIRMVALNLRYVSTEKNFRAMITHNLGFEKNPVIRFIPLFLKTAIVKVWYDVIAENDTSSLLTNLGQLDIPEELQKYIEKALFVAAPGKRGGARCAVSSVGDTLSFTFINIYKEKDIEREFFTALVKMGVHVKLETNY